jgi:FAD/FMN-containing dehydrogenase/Fe-S oxidoreductase
MPHDPARFADALDGILAWMASTSGRTPASTEAAAELAAELRRAGLAEVSDSALRRALYTSDASLYRVTPAVVACPRDADEVAAALDVCTTLGVPLTCRGAGTSIAGNAVGTGLILDFSSNMADILSLDPEAGVAIVQSGVVQAQLQRAAAPHGLRFGPDPSTHDRCTIGGMVGNDSCGSRSLQYGKTSDNVLGLEVISGAGHRLRLSGQGSGDAELDAALSAIVTDGLATIRTELGRFGRQVSGYALQHLLPEHGFDVSRALVGSEGTLAMVTSATVRLVRDPPHRVLAVLGFADVFDAADAVPLILPLRPATCEGMDSRLVDVVRELRGGGAVPELPPGSAWLFVEVTGDSEDEALSQARQVIKTAGAVSGQVVTDPGHAAALWRIREQGAGLAGRTGPGGAPAYPGWEDSAVPPAAVGAYLRDLDDLMGRHRLAGIPYGHFGDGCVHLRLDFPLDRPGGRAVLREFLHEAAELVTRYGGSLSGEHGDGRTRSELLPVMYSAAALELFGRVKDLFDPSWVLNPGVLVRPAPLDADIRVRPAPRPGGSRAQPGLGLSFPHDGGDFSVAVHRCTGVGKCVASTAGTSRVMCPSYQATRDEKDSTRGRARVLQEMINGSVVTGRWRAPEVHEALDLCLSCKACSAECPAGVDMAAYKAEVLNQAYRGRLRPRSHYALGQLPRWAALASRVPGLANAALTAPGLGRAARLAAGIEPRRSLPPFAAESFRSWYRRQRSTGHGRGATGAKVLLFVDTFTDYFAPEIGQAAVRVLASAGYQVTIPARPTCCAITWISTGQLAAARRILRRTVAELSPALRDGIPVVGLEPSCTATLRSDAADLLGTAQARDLAGSVKTLSELLAGTSGWTPPRLDGTEVVAQPHCHHSAVMGWEADATLLRRAGADLTRLGSCCGLAGNFGMERGHYEVSRAVAQTALLPAVEAAGRDAVVLADGFSCRTQLSDLTPRSGLHLAQLLAARLNGDNGGQAGEPPGTQSRET